MGLQFYNINTNAYVKPVSRVRNTIKVTTPKKKYSKRKLVEHSLTPENLAFLRSLNAI
jgi:hypothetical protein